MARNLPSRPMYSAGGMVDFPRRPPYRVRSIDTHHSGRLWQVWKTSTNQIIATYHHWDRAVDHANIEAEALANMIYAPPRVLWNRAW